MNKLVHIGFGNIVNTDKIIAIVSPEAAPIKRLVQRAKEADREAKHAEINYDAHHPWLVQVDADLRHHEQHRA